VKKVPPRAGLDFTRSPLPYPTVDFRRARSGHKRPPQPGHRRFWAFLRGLSFQGTLWTPPKGPSEPKWGIWPSQAGRKAQIPRKIGPFGVGVVAYSSILGTHSGPISPVVRNLSILRMPQYRGKSTAQRPQPP